MTKYVGIVTDVENSRKVSKKLATESYRSHQTKLGWSNKT